MKMWILIFASIVLMGGCTSNRLTIEERVSLYNNHLIQIKAEEVDRITAFKFRGWRELGNRHLIVSTSLNRNYFISLRNPCIELSHSHSIGINRSDSSLNAKFDSIFVPSFPEQRCFIKTIHKITREQADEIDDLEDNVLEKRRLESESLKEIQTKDIEQKDR